MSDGDVLRDNDIFIYDRQRSEVTGVCEVLSFSDVRVSFTCKSGSAEIDGEELKILSFDSKDGKLVVTGNICSLIYFDDAGQNRKRKFFDK